MFDEATWSAVARRVQQCARRCVHNVDDAQDLAQESVQAALRQDQNRLSTRTDLLSFCLGALRRQVAAYYRRRRYWQMVPLADVEPTTVGDPSTALAGREAVQRAARLAQRLDADERLLLTLLLQGCSRAELAQRLGLTRARLRQQYHRLVQKLKRMDRSDLTRLGGVA